MQTITLPPLKSTDVEVDMQYNGLCHTEIHMRDNDWGISNYPMVAGHEGIGIVRRIGSDVKTHKVGDVVGVTWVRDSCRVCDACLCGRENICRTGYQVSAFIVRHWHRTSIVSNILQIHHALICRACTLARTLGHGAKKATLMNTVVAFRKLYESAHILP